MIAGMARSYRKGDIFRYARRFISRASPAPTNIYPTAPAFAGF